jgi:hypothetical protein
MQTNSKRNSGLAVSPHMSAVETFEATRSVAGYAIVNAIPR